MRPLLILCSNSPGPAHRMVRPNVERWTSRKLQRKADAGAGTRAGQREADAGAGKGVQGPPSQSNPQTPPGSAAQEKGSQGRDGQCRTAVPLSCKHERHGLACRTSLTLSRGYSLRCHQRARDGQPCNLTRGVKLAEYSADGRQPSCSGQWAPAPPCVVPQKRHIPTSGTPVDTVGGLWWLPTGRGNTDSSASCPAGPIFDGLGTKVAETTTWQRGRWVERETGAAGRPRTPCTPP